MEPGAIYLLRGGDLVRHVGQHLGPDQVLRRLTTGDARFLRVRYVGLLVRRMGEEAEFVSEIIRELGLKLPILPPRLREMH